jgi:dihydroorotate dehydrogenase (NAD+) catalytic subunit
LDSQLLRVKFSGLNLKNPTVLASGILGYSAASLQRVAEAGAGAVVTKSVGLVARVGYPNPTVVQVEGGLINAMGLPNSGVEEYANEIYQSKSVFNVPLIVSVYGFSVEEYGVVAQKAVEAGADAVELNVSCPHVKDTGSEMGQNPKTLKEIVSQVKDRIEKPVFVKLTPNVTDIAEMAEAAVSGGADALAAINTVRAIAINVETARPVLSNKRGGLSGTIAKPIALRCVYDIYERVKVPIMGCGGISDWRDAVEFLLAGASAVQIGTAIASKEPAVFEAINLGIAAYLKNKKFGSVTEIVGLAHRS